MEQFLTQFEQGIRVVRMDREGFLEQAERRLVVPGLSLNEAEQVPGLSQCWIGMGCGVELGFSFVVSPQIEQRSASVIARHSRAWL